MKGVFNMKLYTELDFYERFSAAKTDGFESVEFWDWWIRDLDKVRDAAIKAQISISGFNGDNDFSLVDPTHKEKYLENLKASLDAAKKLARSPSRFIQTHSAKAALSSITTMNFPTPLNFARCTTRSLQLSNSPKIIKSV